MAFTGESFRYPGYEGVAGFVKPDFSETGGLFPDRVRLAIFAGTVFLDILE